MTARSCARSLLICNVQHGWVNMGKDGGRVDATSDARWCGGSMLQSSRSAPTKRDMTFPTLADL